MVRQVSPGMGQAVAERTVFRKHRPDGTICQPGEDGEWETWPDVAHRVALGNSMLEPRIKRQQVEYAKLREHMERGRILMSGRHLQNGDRTQPDRVMEVFVNCATAKASFISFYLLLNGSGVGRSYDDELMLVDWDYAPTVRCVLSHEHADFNPNAHESVREARHKYGSGPKVHWHKVADSREGWAKALEWVEVAAYRRNHRDHLYILDFSDVRKKNSLIAGMQYRLASGPVPVMDAFGKLMTIRGIDMPRWLQAMFVDHIFAEPVRVGGARRAARIAKKNWRDPSIIDYIRIKRPIEFAGLTPEQIIALRASLPTDQRPTAFLWSANNSVGVDAEFWEGVESGDPHAVAVFNAITEAAYADGTGEPGFLNLDRLAKEPNRDFTPPYGELIGSIKYQPSQAAQEYLGALVRRAAQSRYPYLVNPCGEIKLAAWGGFCVIGDVVPYHAESLDDAESAFRATTRALIRVNRMPSIYQAEVERTNRIGVGITGLHEFAWSHFGYGFRDLIDEERSLDFWLALSRFKRAVRDEAVSYSAELVMVAPHTDTTIKPAGTTSKLFGLTEGVHLPPNEHYLRWVQYRNDDPLVVGFRESGYPVRELTKAYAGTTIVGFPTMQHIATLGMGEKLVTATEATPEEQFRWLELLEKYWIVGVDEAGQPLADTGNQVSYTLKYDPKAVTLAEFQATIRQYQPRVKCCSVMPTEDTSSYEYLPEQPVTKAEFEAVAASIRQNLSEDVDQVHVDCAGGGCPVDFTKPEIRRAG